MSLFTTCHHLKVMYGYCMHTASNKRELWKESRYIVYHKGRSQNREHFVSSKLEAVKCSLQLYWKWTYPLKFSKGIFWVATRFRFCELQVLNDCATNETPPYQGITAGLMTLARAYGIGALKKVQKHPSPDILQNRYF